jgi:hypothetical protein
VAERSSDEDEKKQDSSDESCGFHDATTLQRGGQSDSEQNR